jgi:hypothetical protein
MRKNGIATLATLMKSQQYRDSSCYETEARGLAVLNSPLLNKGMAFTAKERKALGLTGLLPPEIITLEVQVKSAYTQYGRLTDALSKNIFLTALHEPQRGAVLPAIFRTPVRNAPHRQGSYCRCPKSVLIEKLAFLRFFVQRGVRRTIMTFR